MIDSTQPPSAVITEIINLQAILNLPKPTEAFMSDLHGEYEAFQHVLRTGSGNVKIKVQERFENEMTEPSIEAFAFLLYYPSERLAQVHQQMDAQTLDQWYLTTVKQLTAMLAYTAGKYTRSKLRKALAPEFAYVTEELLEHSAVDGDKRRYYWSIIANLIELQVVDDWIVATAHTISRLTVDHWHIVGDIYDRGPAPDKIVEALMARKQRVDIQWGNHDILWLGGAAGSALNIANLIRISARYNNLAILEDRYGINLRHLARLAERHYQDNAAFSPQVDPDTPPLSSDERLELTKLHQAIAIIQFKLEGAAIDRHPEYHMAHRKLLHRLSEDLTRVTIGNQTYAVTHPAFTTVDPKAPYRLTEEEQAVMDQLVEAFQHSEKLRRHMDFLMAHGHMYLRQNGNLLLHGGVPVDEGGQPVGLTVNGVTYKGRQLFDFLEANLREAYEAPLGSSQEQLDLLWYLWTGPRSPLFGKDEMTTFERYFITDKKAHQEHKNPYYRLRHEQWFVQQLLAEFDLPQTGHVINGHTPVKRGDSPVMGGGQMLVIDGGFAKAYHHTTGISGYTLLDSSYGMQLVVHQGFTSRQEAIAGLQDSRTDKQVVAVAQKRKLVADTDVGRQIRAELRELKQRWHEQQADR